MRVTPKIQKFLSAMLALSMVMQYGPVTVFAAEDKNYTAQTTGSSLACTCGTDDQAFHATDCLVYVAPENPKCWCAEKCTEINTWCDVCGFDYTSCKGTDVAVTYGSCGKSASWSYNSSNKTLTISGSGPMDDFSPNDIPWYGYRALIEHIVIGYDISSIGKYSFYQTPELKTVSISKTVTGINAGAFWGCPKLTRVTFAEGSRLTTIGENAFAFCTDLYTITIPADVTLIDYFAFGHCDGFREIKFQGNAPEIRQNAFGNYDNVIFSITAYYTENDETWADIVNRNRDDDYEYYGEFIKWQPYEQVCHNWKNATCITPKTCTICSMTEGAAVANAHIFNGGSLCSLCRLPYGLSYTVSNDQVTITGYTGSLEELTIPAAIAGKAVTCIGDRAFSNNRTLTSVILPDSVTTIGERAFFMCSSLSSIDFGNSLTSIGDSAFYYCDGLTELVFPDSLITISDFAFSDCQYLKKVTFGKNLTTIGEFAFAYSTYGLTTVTIPASVTSIGVAAFSGAKMEAIWVDENNSVYSSDANGVLFNKDKTELLSVPVANRCSYEIPDGVVRIGEYAFLWNNKLTNVTIPDSVTTIESKAFAACLKLNSVTMGTGISAIGSSAFSDCQKLTDVYYVGNQEKWDNITFETGNDVLTSATIHYSCLCTEGHTFENGVCFCGEPEDLCGSGHDRDENYQCVNCGHIGGTLNEEITWELTDDVLTVTGTGYIPYQKTRQWESYVEQIEKVVLSHGIEGIGTSTDGSVFAYMPALEEVVLPETLASIGSYAFYDCDTLSEIVLPEGLCFISTAAFSNSGLTSVYVPETVWFISDGAFSYCSDLEEINVSENNQYFSSLDGVLFNKAKTELLGYPAGKQDESYTIPETVTSVVENAFASNNFLHSVTIPGNITTISEYMFIFCENLETVQLQEGIVTIGERAFQYCESLKQLTVPGSVRKIANNVFTFSGMEELFFTGSFPAEGIMDAAFAYADFIAYYPKNDPTWTVSVRKSYGGTVEWVAYGDAGEDLELEVKIPGADKSGAVVTAPEGGWVEGTNTFTVSCSDPCVVAVSYDGSQTYVKLTATEAEAGYSFTAENMTAETVVAVAVQGDANGDGKITNADVTRLRAAFMGKTTVDALTQLAIDANGDGKISNADVTKLRAVFFGKTSLNW